MPSPPPKKAESKAAPISSKEDKEAIRKGRIAIQKAANAGLLLKVTGYETRALEVFTGALWDASTIDLKNQILEGVAMISFYERQLESVEGLTVVVKDGGNGKRIGKWTPYAKFKAE